MMAVSTLLKSCATPPATGRSHLLRLREIFLKRALLGRVERVEHQRRVLRSFFGGGGQEDAGAGTAIRYVDRRLVRLAGQRRLHRGAHGGVALRSCRQPEVGRCPGLSARRGSSLANGAFDCRILPSPSISAIAIGVELKKRANLTSAARRFSPGSSPAVRLRTSVRLSPGWPSAEKATRCSRRAGRRWPPAPDRRRSVRCVPRPVACHRLDNGARTGHELSRVSFAEAHARSSSQLASVAFM